MAKFATQQLTNAAVRNIAGGKDSYPEFEPEYEQHIAAGGMNLEDFKIGFTMGYQVAKEQKNG